MMNTYKLGPASQIPEGEGRTFKVGTREVAVFRTRQGGVFATQASCPHKQGPLADGLVGGAHLVCPLHEWRFDLKTGQAVGNDGCLAVYPIHEEASGELAIELPAE